MATYSEQQRDYFFSALEPRISTKKEGFSYGDANQVHQDTVSGSQGVLAPGALTSFDDYFVNRTSKPQHLDTHKHEKGSQLRAQQSVVTQQIYSEYIPLVLVAGVLLYVYYTK